MLLNSLMGAGVAGMQHSQSKMVAAAEDIARAGLPPEGGGHYPLATGQVPVTEAGAAADDLTAQQAVPALGKSDRSGGGDLTQALVEQRKQLSLFDASAKLVKSADEALGSLIDDLT